MEGIFRQVSLIGTDVVQGILEQIERLNDSICAGTTTLTYIQGLGE